MITVGISELRRVAGMLIRRVVAGETIEVTKRGRPVARIVPLFGMTVLDQMVASGRATPARADLLELKPFPSVSGKRPLSEVLSDLRADER
jgi:prevent-host-death family protein